MSVPHVDATPLVDVWRRVFPRLDALYRAFSFDGLLIVAVSQRHTLDAHLHVPIELDPAFISVGRHTECDVVLDRDDTVSLRHSIISAGRRGSDLRVRLFDLHSGSGMIREDGLYCEGIAADGPVFVRFGSYRLFLLPTGALAPLPWGRTADESWDSIPERVYFGHSMRARSEMPSAPKLKPQVGRSIVNTMVTVPPTSLRQRRPPPGSRGDRIGVLELAAGGAAESYVLHETDVDCGVLIGRYERCAFGAEDARLSRVHLLIVRDGGEIWAVDTASSNGTTAAGEPIRQHRLGDATELLLGDRVRLLWRAQGRTR